MNRPSRDLGSKNVLCIRPKPLPEVATMPARRPEGRGAVMQMRARLSHGDCGTQSVLTMPSRSNRAQNHAAVIEMLSCVEEKSETLESHAADRGRLIDAGLSLSDGLRMTLVALFALLGWPRPTHGKDPGTAAARPFKLELTNVISGLRIPIASPASLAARSTALQFPQSVRTEIGADLARAA